MVEGVRDDLNCEIIEEEDKDLFGLEVARTSLRLEEVVEVSFREVQMEGGGGDGVKLERGVGVGEGVRGRRDERTEEPAIVCRRQGISFGIPM